jgi:hypothetical protein
VKVDDKAVGGLYDMNEETDTQKINIYIVQLDVLDCALIHSSATEGKGIRCMEVISNVGIEQLMLLSPPLKLFPRCNFCPSHFEGKDIPYYCLKLVSCE